MKPSFCLVYAKHGCPCFKFRVRINFGCIELLFTVFELAGDCHLDLSAFFNIPCPALGLRGWNDGDGRILCTGAGFQPAG